MLEEILLGVLSNVLYEGGETGLRRFLIGSPVRLAIKASAHEFPGVSGLNQALNNWCRSDQFASLIESFSLGKLPNIHEAMIDSFVGTGMFYDGLINTHETARRVLEAFWSHLERELYKSGEGALIEAQRGKIRHSETQAKLEELRGQLLESDRAKASGSGPGCVPPYQLWAPLPDFVGRKKVIDELLHKLRVGCHASICGMGGVGKTELALFVAHLLRNDYADAQLFVNMHGTGAGKLDVGDALAACIRSLAGPEGRIPDSLDERGALYHSLLSGKRALILLDNVADEAKLRLLLPPPGNVLLVTSRRALAAPGVERIELREFDAEQAQELLLKLAPHVEPGVADVICRLCGYLPLAIRAAGNLLRVTTDLKPSEYAVKLEDERTRLEEIGTEGVEAGVEASFNLSYESLRAETASIFLRLSVFPATFGADAEEKVCRDDLHLHLSELVRRGMVMYDQASDRYRLHDLMRVFAGKRLTEEACDLAERHCGYYLLLLEDINKLFISGEATTRGLSLFDLEWSNIRAGQSWAVEHAHERRGAALACSDYPNAGANLLHLRLSTRDYVGWLRAAISAARSIGLSEVEGKNLFHLGNAYDDLGDALSAMMCYEQSLTIFRKTDEPRCEAAALHGMASQYEHLGQTDDAVGLYEQALGLARQVGDPDLEAAVLSNLGNAYTTKSDLHRALSFYQQALPLASGRGDRRSEGTILANLGNLYSRLGESSSALGFYEQSLSIFRGLGDRRGEGEVLGCLGVYYEEVLGETAKAVEYYERRLGIAREIDDRRGEAITLFNLSLAVAKLGDRRRAIDYAGAALKLFEQIDDPRATVVREQLSRWRSHV